MKPAASGNQPSQRTASTRYEPTSVANRPPIRSRCGSAISKASSQTSRAGSSTTSGCICRDRRSVHHGASEIENTRTAITKRAGGCATSHGCSSGSRTIIE
jgi:hypothetical protein